MKVGDSFFIKVDKDKNDYDQKQKVRLAVWRFKKRNTNTDFSTSSVEDGLRVWRIK